jgi:SAM-dependent MidA family methyltransferase
MSPLTELLRDRIQREGSIPFATFMEVALYHPEWGYYRGKRDPFGVAGDFYTAEQLQPVFGILLRALARRLPLEAGATVVELGAGRAEMAPYFAGWHYVPVDYARGQLPASFHGLVLANEFFDALPVHLVERRKGRLYEVMVGWRDGFCWETGATAPEPVAAYVARYLPGLEEGQRIEVNLKALEMFDAIDRSLVSGYLLAIDYGYTERELSRFPEGTLMSYRRHRALENVLANPGEQDITAHVNFSALRAHAEARGWRVERFESLQRTLMDAGEEDHFAGALAGEPRRRQQLKALLFSFGEMFRTLLVAREKRPQ